ncbi:jouberin-like [Odontomachus brunneus]|uniref:jouberin-like n=1 Tax=Odontomachus brunneus TaxID=486640 RepID=UPI0013F25A65|nr:jouberin-like [Odontomachus brunneus]
MASRGRILKRSRHVSSFLEESMESATPSKTTVDVVVDVHNEGERLQQDNESVPVAESSDEKEAKQSERSDGSKGSSKQVSEAPRDRRVVVTRTRLDETRDRVTLESFDLIEEIGAPERSSKTPEEIEPFPEVKPRRRKQWSTVNVASEPEDISRRQPRKRWSKDTSVIRLPETRDSSPLIDNGDVEEPRKPVPAPRSNVRRNAFFFDNPAFVSENEEVLRIETDHQRESTKIEMRRMSDRSSNVEDVEETRTSGTSSGSLKKNAQETSMRSKRERFADSGARSTRTSRSSGSRKNSTGEMNSSSSLGKVTDIQSSSITYEETSTGDKKYPEAIQDRGLRKRERSLFRKKDVLSNDEKVSSSAKDGRSTGDTEADTRVRRKKRKKRKQGKEDRDKEKSDKREEAEVKYISVTVHRTDLLEADYANAKRPMVKVHIVDARTGNYLRSTDNCENVSVFLQPMITGKFDFKENRSMIPVWEEELIFEHDFNAITRRNENSQVVILFEVIDPLSFAEASFSYDRFGNEGCWNKIAWAFLKPLGCNDTLHTDKKIRLQLYKPRRSFKKYDRHKCEVYAWWQSNNRDKYPSSLFVTVTSVSPPKVKPVLYRQLAMKDVYDTRSDLQHSYARTSTALSLPKWARLAAQSCKIPNEKVFETETSENGCFYVAFSSDGKYLACVHSEEYSYPVVVYEVETGKIHVRFLGHKTFVYSLSWSSDDRCLLSASADQTARIWDVRNRIVQQVEMLPHPTYVYCAKYAPGNTTIVATGCYDRIARIWANDKRSRERVLCQELEGHEGFINSVVFQKSDDLITADSVGMIIVWSARKNSKMPSKREWFIARRIKVREIEGVVINTIALHPLESRLLVHSRNSGLRMLDIATGVVLQRYDGLNNQKVQTKACISPCGSLVFCGGEDSVLNVWHLETGEHLAKYTNERDYRAVTCVDYHPYNHVLAYSGFGGPTAVRVLRFNKDASNNDVGLMIIAEARNSREQSIDSNHRFRSTGSLRNAQQSKSYTSRLLLNEFDETGLQTTSSDVLEPQRRERHCRDDLYVNETRRRIHHWPENLQSILAGTTPNVMQQFNGSVEAAEEGRAGVTEELQLRDMLRTLRLQRPRSSDLPPGVCLPRDATDTIGETSRSETSRGNMQNKYRTRATNSAGHKENVEKRHSPRRFSADVIIDVDPPNLEQTSRSDSSPRSDGTFVITREHLNQEV